MQNLTRVKKGEEWSACALVEAISIPSKEISNIQRVRMARDLFKCLSVGHFRTRLKMGELLSCSSIICDCVL